MKSLPPRSDSNSGPPEGGAPERTDFKSLMAGGVAQRQVAREAVRTDFHTLRASTVASVKLTEHRTITDWLIDGLTPFMIFVMVYSVIFFLLDVRYVYLDLDHSLQGQMVSMYDKSLRFVALCFVVGVVALNRLIVRDGKEESILYIIAFSSVVGLYTFSTTQQIGSVAHNFMNQPYAATVFNMGIVALIWWVTNRLTHECCVDENPEAGDVGMLTGTLRRLQGVARKVSQPDTAPAHPRKNEPMIMINEIAPYDPSERKAPAQGTPSPPPDTPAKRLPKRHPGISVFYTSIPAMLIFAVGHRVLLNGDPSRLSKAHWFITAYTVAALALLMLSSLGGLREYFRARRVRIPAGIGPFWIGLGSVMVLIVVVGAARLPGPPTPPAAKLAVAPSTHVAPDAGDGETQENASAGGSGSSSVNDPDASSDRPSPTEEQGAAPSDKGGRKQTAQDGGARRGQGDPRGQQDSQGRDSQGREDGQRRDARSATPPAQSRTDQSPAVTPTIDFGGAGRFMEVLGQIVLVCIAILFLFGVLRLLGALAFSLSRGSRGYAGALRRFFGALDRFLQKVLRFPSLPRIRPARRVSHEVATCTRFSNPLANTQMTPQELVEYSYSALCALANDMAVPRRKDQTPYEFINAFPSTLETLREDAVELTNLYVVSAYSGTRLEEATLDRLRKFWNSYDRVRAMVIH